MSDRQKPDEPRKGGMNLGPAYDSVHGDANPKIAASPARIDWRLPLVVLVLVSILAAGVVYSLQSAPPTQPWLDLQEIRVASDEGYLYLLIRTRADTAQPDWNRVAFRIGFDTYDAERGSRYWPAPLDAKIGSGIEFLLDVRGPERTEMFVVNGYDPYEEENPIVSPRASAPGFRRMMMTANRERYGRDGTHYPAITVNRGIFRFGSTDPSREDYLTNADITTGPGIVEMRIPWGLLNVSDPSSRRVLHSEGYGREEVGTTGTNGFRIYVVSWDPRSNQRGAADAIPRTGRAAPLYRWDAWESPEFTVEPKLGFNEIRDTMKSLPSHPGEDRE
jgi:hypothetical protein